LTKEITRPFTNHQKIHIVKAQTSEESGLATAVYDTSYCAIHLSKDLGSKFLTVSVLNTGISESKSLYESNTFKKWAFIARIKILTRFPFYQKIVEV
jgi:hypothetical protein